VGGDGGLTAVAFLLSLIFSPAGGKLKKDFFR
jgi:hypothetical protein